MYKLSILLTAILSLACFVIFNLQAQELLGITRISQNILGNGGNAASGALFLSANGRFVAFRSLADNLVQDDTNNSADIFLKDSQTGFTRRINLSRSGNEANGGSFDPQISPASPNGFVAVVYASNATNLVRFPQLFPDTNDATDIYFTLPLRNITERISIAPGPAQANGASNQPSVTILPEPNRLLVAYTSEASNLVDSDTNGKQDIFLATALGPDKGDIFDIRTDLSTILVSKPDTLGATADGDSFRPAISGNGKFIAYESLATNLISGSAPQTRQIYLYNIATKTTTLISKSPSGDPGDGASFAPSINYTGNFITYFTGSTNIVGDGKVTTPKFQIVRYDVLKNKTERVNINSNGDLSDGTAANGTSPVISPDGRAIIFSDNGSNLVSGDANGVQDVYVKDMATGQLARLSQGLSGSDSDGASFSPVIAGNGFVAQTATAGFVSEATNLISGDTEGKRDIFTASITIPPVPLTAKSSIQVPPDVSIGTDNKRLTVALQAFSSVKVKPKSLFFPKISRPTIQYRVQAISVDRPDEEARNKLVKKSEVSYRSLPSGTYRIRYRVETIQNSKIISKTKYSPEERVTIE